ncbi:MAG: hypothetical protein AB9873_13135 [Syntrophobacteraceae bacterium]
MSSRTTSMGDHAGIAGGLVNAAAGEHAYKTEIINEKGDVVATGYGHNSKESLDNANANASKK